MVGIMKVWEDKQPPQPLQGGALKQPLTKMMIKN